MNLLLVEKYQSKLLQNVLGQFYISGAAERKSLPFLSSEKINPREKKYLTKTTDKSSWPLLFLLLVY